MAAVVFTITIPTADDEERMKIAFLDKARNNATTTVTTNSPSSKTTTEGSHSMQALHLHLAPTKPQNIVGRRKSLSMPTIQVELIDGERTPDTPAAEKSELYDLPLETAMEHVLHKILHKFEIVDDVWLMNKDKTKYHITFTVPFDEQYEQLYETLQEWGIGDREGSTVRVMNCIANKSYNRSDATNSSHRNDQSTDNTSAVKSGGIWNRFMNSVRSRLNVAQIVRDVRQDAAITFDFCILLISAAVLASFGLVENSTIFLASSMLISPLMGPIIAAIFGTVIQERSLRNTGMRNELIGILLATVVGFLFGLIVCTTDQRYGIGEGLTDEMLSRCDLRSLVVGVFTAIPSGAAAAIAILGGNIGSLVGVAISASLLPPAVNSGLLWALAAVYKYFENDNSRYLYVVKSRKYSENQAAELAILASISMCLTLTNVICVYVMGILVLKVKEIAPVIAHNNSRFWKHDIKLARGRDTNDLVCTDTALIDEFVHLPKEEQQVLVNNCDFLRNLDESATQHTWSPLSKNYTPDGFCRERGSYSTLNQLERLFSTITHSTDPRRRSEHRIPRRSTYRPADLSNQLFLLDQRPRLATMPTSQNVINEKQSKRFTVTRAHENSLIE